nr:hypothetical protein BaRGS_023587 [Batillaria attramentaria]
MSILGKGSMRDKQKEEELRKEGGKFAHLNDELHVYVEVFAEMTDAYTRLSHAVTELKKFLIPEGNDDIRQQQLQELMYINQVVGPQLQLVVLPVALLAVLRHHHLVALLVEVEDVAVQFLHHPKYPRAMTNTVL